MGNGLILAFVVVVWAAYFVPLALRRYDEAARDVEVESDARGRVIAASPSRRSEAEVEQAPQTESVPVETAQAGPAPVRRSTRIAARRRRRVLITLVMATSVVGTLAALSVVKVHWVAVPVALDVAWLVACRLQVRRELGIARPRVRHGSEASTTLAADDEQTIIVSGLLEDVDPGRKHVMEDVALEVDALEEQLVIAVPSISTAGDALWDPLPVTLPTYVTKPRAGRTVRTIDFAQAGTWTSGHVEGEDVELPQRRDDDDERRAVGH